MRERMRYSGCKKQVGDEGRKEGGRKEGGREEGGRERGREGRREKTIEDKIIKQRKGIVHSQEDR